VPTISFPPHLEVPRSGITGYKLLKPNKERLTLRSQKFGPNSFNPPHDVTNLFITDGAAMVSSSCVNPSLTYMAVTARACDFAVQQMKKGEL
jgi:hypothetical protein